METLQVNADRATGILNAQLLACTDDQCRGDITNVLGVVQSARTGAKTVHGLIANTPNVIGTAGIAAAVSLQLHVNHSVASSVTYCECAS